MNLKIYSIKLKLISLNAISFITLQHQRLNISNLRQNLVSHLINPVLWSQSMNHINSLNGIVIECGPGKVLTGLAKSNGIKNIFTSSSENFFNDIKSAL